ncbi:hypothetical protein [Kitasatospora sp. NBC_01539]|uniref:hypothetical protein n=1 Tax=Kitasatospora sp. NBC_01539 TaxID=2903577 RepID=UPI003860335E
MHARIRTKLIRTPTSLLAVAAAALGTPVLAAAPAAAATMFGAKAGLDGRDGPALNTNTASVSECTQALGWNGTGPIPYSGEVAVKTDVRC